jgi:hypothetical protein
MEDQWLQILFLWHCLHILATHNYVRFLHSTARRKTHEFANAGT